MRDPAETQTTRLAADVCRVLEVEVGRDAEVLHLVGGWVAEFRAWLVSELASRRRAVVA